MRIRLRMLPAGEAKPWPQRLLRAPAELDGRPLERQTETELDARSMVETRMVPVDGAPPVGRYEAQACLGATGDWRGNVCSEPVRIEVVAGAGLTQQQRDDAGRQAARIALLRGDWAELQRLGQEMLPRSPVAGQTALGDAYFGRRQWEQALGHYTAARTAYGRGGHGEAPRALNLRISRLLEILENEP